MNLQYWQARSTVHLAEHPNTTGGSSFSFSLAFSLVLFKDLEEHVISTRPQTARERLRTGLDLVEVGFGGARDEDYRERERSRIRT